MFLPVTSPSKLPCAVSISLQFLTEKTNAKASTSSINTGISGHAVRHQDWMVTFSWSGGNYDAHHWSCKPNEKQTWTHQRRISKISKSRLIFPKHVWHVWLSKCQISGEPQAAIWFSRPWRRSISTTWRTNDSDSFVAWLPKALEVPKPKRAKMCQIKRANDIPEANKTHI